LHIIKQSGRCLRKNKILQNSSIKRLWNKNSLS